MRPWAGGVNGKKVKGCSDVLARPASHRVKPDAGAVLSGFLAFRTMAVHTSLLLLPDLSVRWVYTFTCRWVHVCARHTHVQRGQGTPGMVELGILTEPGIH